MSISSINFQTAKSNSSAHMSRDSFVSYLIEHDTTKHEYRHYQDPKEYLEFALVQTKLLTRRKMQDLASKKFIQEAVLNIKKDTTIREVENLFKKFSETKFKGQKAGGFKVFEIALHKDEGVFVDTKYDVEDLTFESKTLKIFKDDIDVSDEVIAYAPSKDIFYNQDTKKWYKEKTFENEFDTSNLQKKMNYHAHISFTKWDENTGKNIRIQKGDLQTIQTITAREMKMERGEVNSQTKRLNHYQIKKLQAEINSQKIENRELKLVTVPHLKKSNQLKDLLIIKSEQELATAAQLKIEIKILREQLKEQGAVRADYANLEALNQELQEKIKAKYLTIEELQAKKNNYITAFKQILPTAKNQEEVIEYVKTLKNELQDTKTLKADNATLKSDLSVLKQDMSVLQQDITKTKSIKNDLNLLVQILPPEKVGDLNIKKPLIMRVSSFISSLKTQIKELAEQVKTQTQDILSLKTQVQQLKLENQKYKSLVSSKVAELVPNEDELTKFKRELPKKLFNTRANDLIKELSGSYDELKDQKIKIIDEHISNQVQAMLKNSTAATREDLREAERGYQKTQSNYQGYSR